MKDTSLIKICLSAIVVSISIFVTALAIAYIAVDRRSPSVNEASVPAPKPD